MTTWKLPALECSTLAKLNVLLFAPEMLPPSVSALPSLNHWKCSGGAPEATTLSDGVVPTTAVVFAGWLMIPGGLVTEVVPLVQDREKLSSPTVSRELLPVEGLKATRRIQTFSA